MGKRFAAAINCMDGRVQEPIINYMKAHYKVDYVDMITEPGPNKILSDKKDNNILESIKKRVEISVKKHHSQVIAVVGHYDCAGNPASDNEQKAHLLSAINYIKEWNMPVDTVIGLWVDGAFKVSSVD